MTPLISEVYSLVESGNDRKASDLVIDQLDRMLSGGRLSEVDEILALVEFKRLPSHVRRAFLMMTFPVKDKLPSRLLRFDDAKQLLTEAFGAEEAQRRLRTLE